MPAQHHTFAMEFYEPYPLVGPSVAGTETNR
jgi:hypothetical protein